MKITLISHTPNAAQLLVFTKSTRLTMSPGLFDEIAAWPADKIEAELAYMAETIPSSWEFVDYVFLVEGVSRAYTHQQVRTRNASFAQQTMRVLDMGDFEYVYTENNLASDAAKEVIDHTNEFLSAAYRALIVMGQAPEDARGILPTNISTNIVCKFNLRTLSELCKSRTGGRTQNEYQRVMGAMADAVLAVHPWAERFLFPAKRDAFDAIEAFAKEEFGGDLLKKGKLLKIVDQMRKAAK
jgi:flavin-dependent thymidylate synthase